MDLAHIPNRGHGDCDAFTGACVCDAGFVGHNCTDTLSDVNFQLRVHDPSSTSANRTDCVVVGWPC